MSANDPKRTFALRQGTPEGHPRLMVDRGVSDKYEYVLQSVKEIGFRWREYESEDTVRFWACPARTHR